MFFPSGKPSKCNQQMCFRVNVNSITGIKVSLQFLKRWSPTSTSCSLKMNCLKIGARHSTRLTTLHQALFQNEPDLPSATPADRFYISVQYITAVFIFVIFALSTLLLLITACQESCGTVMFSVVSVILLGWGWGWTLYGEV